MPEENLHFLGLPDGFLEDIYADRQGSAVFSPLLGSDRAPYRGLRRVNLPYRKAAVLTELTGLLSEIRPDTIYVSHPDERDGDHRAAGRLTIEATRELAVKPAIRTDQFYGKGAGTAFPASWKPHTLFSPGEAMAIAREAYWFYQTQGGNQARGHVLSYADLPRQEHHLEITY